MTTHPGTNDPADAEPLPTDPTGQDPTAKDPMADEKLHLQLAIFDVTRQAQGRALDDIQDMLRSAFAAHGVQPPPDTWLESVASSAFYGEPYIIDYPTALAADNVAPAPNSEVRERLAHRRELREEKLPPGIFPAPSEWELSPGEVTTTGTGAHRVRLPEKPRWSRPVLIAAAFLGALAVALLAGRTSASRSLQPSQLIEGADRKGNDA